MSFSNRTPESLVCRADSKNPATTCKGITSGGRPCRRPLAPSNSSSPSAAHPGFLDACLLYCWQHKDQAPNVAIDSPSGGIADHKRPARFQSRNSIDSLVDRLGILSTSDPPQHTPTPADLSARYTSKYHHRGTRSPSTHPKKPLRPDQPSEKSQIKLRKRPGFWASLCCMSSHDEDDYFEVGRHKPRTQAAASQVTTGSHAGTPGRPDAQLSRLEAGRRPVANTATKPNASSSSLPPRRPLATLSPQNGNMRMTSTPDTRHLLSFLPQHVSPQTASALLSELSKPISPHDEAGYIYIFWLTDGGGNAPSESAAASLLASPTTRQSRRASDVMGEYSHAVRQSNAPAKNTIRLKIGRANNVHRRMNEWTRQCGYNLSLVRWYPYVPSLNASPLPSPERNNSLHPDQSRPAPEILKPNQVHKVQHAHRVERLIHLELAHCQVKQNCATCGKEHREWFEIEATEMGVRGVDQVIRRWVKWAETVVR